MTVLCILSLICCSFGDIVQSFNPQTAISFRRVKGLSEDWGQSLEFVTEYLKEIGVASGWIEVQTEKDLGHKLADVEGDTVVLSPVLLGSSDYLLLLEMERCVRVLSYRKESEIQNEFQAQTLAILREVGRFLTLSPQQQSRVLEVLSSLDSDHAEQLRSILTKALDSGLGGVFERAMELANFLGYESSDTNLDKIRELFLHTNPNYKYFVEKYGSEENFKRHLQEVLGRSITEEEFYQLVIGTVGIDAWVRPQNVALIKSSPRAPPYEEPDIAIIGGSTWPNLFADKVREVNQEARKQS